MTTTFIIPHDRVIEAQRSLYSTGEGVWARWINPYTGRPLSQENAALAQRLLGKEDIVSRSALKLIRKAALMVMFDDADQAVLFKLAWVE
ncbi:MULTISPECIES: hypothetical protein [Sphingomonas]|uniref:hypothetical protein n=1 Tax=Sphingomonas TaxID=13687 RepID=UPI00234F39C4|nr:MULTISPECIES: hypothetical protein [Sphingomonas]WCP72174.1 hypothetical protein PPZ50_00970 [Sphingomonas hankookensis]